jgi:uncharacterized protein YjeT (DUF2065 family)
VNDRDFSRSFYFASGGIFMWQEIGIAFSLVLVIEGILPFLYPSRWKELVSMLAEVSDKTMRMAGLFSMLVGTAMLYLIR